MYLHFLFSHLRHFCALFRCQLRDMELAIDEKDSAIKELKEKVVELSSMIRKPVANTCDTKVSISNYVQFPSH